MRFAAALVVDAKVGLDQVGDYELFIEARALLPPELLHVLRTVLEAELLDHLRDGERIEPAQAFGAE